MKTKTAQHTPGPLQVISAYKYSKSRLYAVVDSENTVIAEGMSLPDANLYAAAPELKQQLRIMAEAFHINGRHGGTYEACDSAVCEENREILAKAEGGN